MEDSFSRFYQILEKYNPWWSGKGFGYVQVESFRRPVFRRIWNDLESLPQIISITGPRRVGKTTIIYQLIEALIEDKKVDPQRIIYFSLDDPLLFDREFGSRFLDAVVDHFREKAEALIPQAGERPFYFFLDEVQRYQKWELYLKKYYDLNYPFRFVISGSASSPLLRQSRESLLGRVKDYHLLPFSFKEFLLFKIGERGNFRRTLERYKDVRTSFISQLELKSLQEDLLAFHREMAPLNTVLDHEVISYHQEGGFPEVWRLTDPVKKQEYLWENQINKVLLEDLLLVKQFRKPQNIINLFTHLLVSPGIEINLQTLAKNIGADRLMIEEYFRLLEFTDLIRALHKFSRKALKVKRGNFKCYLVDFALRNAVLKIWDSVATDDTTLGFYAENLVFNCLQQWPEKIELSYFREKNNEVDFIVSLTSQRYLPVEVKFRKTVRRINGMRYFMKKHKIPLGLRITKETEIKREEGVLTMPLRYFLLLFESFAGSA
jgi:predicted AAA+ superfamily ATPase